MVQTGHSPGGRGPEDRDGMRDGFLCAISDSRGVRQVIRGDLRCTVIARTRRESLHATDLKPNQTSALLHCS